MTPLCNLRKFKLFMPMRWAIRRIDGETNHASILVAATVGGTNKRKNRSMKKYEDAVRQKIHLSGEFWLPRLSWHLRISIFSATNKTFCQCSRD